MSQRINTFVNHFLRYEKDFNSYNDNGVGAVRRMRKEK